MTSSPLFSWEKEAKEDADEEEYINPSLEVLGGGSSGLNGAMSDMAAFYGLQSFESKFS